MFVFMYVAVIVWGSVGIVVVQRPLSRIVFVRRGVLRYVCVRGVMDVMFSVCIVRRGTVGVHVWEV